jgi:hypothetical protein
VFFFNALLHKTPFQELAPTKSNLLKKTYLAGNEKEEEEATKKNLSHLNCADEAGQRQG